MVVGRWVQLASAVLLVGFAYALGGCSERPGPRNVVLVSLDTLRADRLGFHGYARETSPFLDELARTSVVFESAQTQAPWTLPGHAAMLTSLYPSTLALGSATAPRPVPDRVETLAEALDEHGFRTHAVVDGGFVARALGFAQGFVGFVHLPEPKRRGYGYSADRIMERATQWLRSLRRDERFFLFLHTYAVHDYNPPQSARARLVRPYRGPLARMAAFEGLLQDRENQALTRGLGPADRQFVSDLYDATILEADEALRRLHETLESLGLLDDTLLVVTSDHGEEIFDRRGTGHGYTMYEENLHVPLLFSHRSLAPTRIAAPVRLIDVAPTIVDLLGFQKPSSWQGVSLKPLMQGEAIELPAFSGEAHAPLQAVRIGSIKLIQTLDGSHQEIYDLRADPAERQNLLGAGHAEEEEVLQSALDQWQRSVRSQGKKEPEREAPLDPRLREQLEQLGYLDPDKPSEPELR
jgi:arylsulfatase A-like enzyme